MSDNDISRRLTSISDAPGQRQLPRRARLIGYAVGILLTAGIAALAFWITTTVRGNPTLSATSVPEDAATAAVPLALQRPIVTEEGLVEKSGVRLVYVAITGGGGLIDLRFQVVDPDKATAVHEENYPPTIVDEATGLVVNELLMGHIMSTNFTAGQTYYLIFENPGNIVQSGGTVSVLLGDAQVNNVIVK